MDAMYYVIIFYICRCSTQALLVSARGCGNFTNKPLCFKYQSKDERRYMSNIISLSITSVIIIIKQTSDLILPLLGIIVFIRVILSCGSVKHD